MIAHDGDANLWAVRVGNALDRRACRHQEAVVQLQNGRRELDASPRRVGPHKSHVASAGRQARQHLGDGRMSDRHDLGPDPRSKGARKVEKNDSQRRALHLAGLRVLSVHHGVDADPDLAGLREIGDTRVSGRLRLRKAGQHGSTRNGENELVHRRLHGFPMRTASERGRVQWWCRTAIVPTGTRVSGRGLPCQSYTV